MTATVISTVLNRENYEDWSFRMKTYFLAKDLWDIVKGTVNKPPEGEEHKAWKKKDAKALYAIQNSCGDDTYPLVKNTTSAEAAWRSLSLNLKQDEKPDDKSAHKPVGEAYPNRPESVWEEGLNIYTGRGHDEIRETFGKYVWSNDWDNAINFLRQHPQAAAN